MTTQISDLSLTIGEVMGSVLDRGPLAADEDFFEAGGDSLRAVEVLQRFVTEYELPAGVQADELQAELLVSIFDEATPSALAAVATTHFAK